MNNRISFQNKTTVGTVLLGLYILTSYVAQGIVVSDVVNSAFLYLFLAWGVVTGVMESSVTITPFKAWYGIFLGLSVLTLVYSPEPFTLLDGSIYFVLVAFILTCFMQRIVTSKKAFQSIAVMYTIASTALMFLLFVTGNLSSLNGIRLGEELVGNNANVFARMMMTALMYELWLLVYEPMTTRLKVLLVLCMGANVVGLFLSGGRTFIVVPVIFLYILLLFKKDRHGRGAFFGYTCLIVVIAVLLWNLMMRVPIFYEMIGSRMEGLLHVLTGEGTVDASTVIRDRMKPLALKGWLQSPLFGHGFDSFKYYNLDVLGRIYYSHCNFTELLYNGGILYFGVYYWFYYDLVKRAIKQKKIPTAYRAFAAAAVVSLLALDYGSVSYFATPTIIMLMMADSALRMSAADKGSELENEKPGQTSTVSLRRG